TDGSQPIVSIAGSASFHYSSGNADSSQNGFFRDSFDITGFGFLGQSIGALGGGPGLAAITFGSPRQGGSSLKTSIGPITLGTPSISLSHFGFSATGGL